MKQFNREIGRIGEEATVKYLADLGYEIIERNASTKFGELDIVCKDKDVWVFVEVKSKKGLNFGTPEEMFDRRKYYQIKRLATMYLHGKEVKSRIDMVAVVLGSSNQVVSLKHYDNVIL